MLNQGFHQLLVGGDGAVGHLDGDDVPGGAGLALVNVTPANAQALETANTLTQTIVNLQV